MAITLTKLTNGAIQVVDGTIMYTLNNLQNVKIIKTTVNAAPAIKITWSGGGELKFLPSDIGLINGAAAPAALDDIRTLLATAVFNFGGGNGSGVTTASVSAQISAAITALALDATYKRRDKLIEIAIALDFPSIPANSASAGLVITNTDTAGLTGSDRVMYCFSSNMNKALNIYGIPGTNLITFYAVNPTLAAIDNPNGTYRVTVYKTG